MLPVLRPHKQVRHALYMYASGKKNDTLKFKGAAWPRFDEYLTALEQFETASTEMQELWLAYRQQLFQKGL